MQHSLSVSLAGEGPQPANDPRGHGPPANDPRGHGIPKVSIIREQRTCKEVDGRHRSAAQGMRAALQVR